MKEWIEDTLGCLIRIKHGFAFKGEFFADSGEYLLLTPGNVWPSGGLKLKGEKEKFYSGKFPDEYLLKKGDLLTVMTDLTQDASILGGALVIDQDGMYLHNQRLGLITIHGSLDKRFLFYYLNWQYFRDQVKASSNGATVKHTAPERIYKCKIKRPSLAIQRRVAAILTAYDDLIEVNKRRIALLEKMAEELYREWFVRLRFPGHQNTRFVKGVPEGWDTLRFSEICKFIKGKTPSQLIAEPFEDYLPYVNAAFLRGDEPEFAKRERGSVLCDQGDVLMLMDGSNSGLVFRAKGGVVASTFSRIGMENKYRHFIFEFLRASQESIIANNTGSAVPHANKEFVNRLVIFVPDSDQLLSTFNKNYQAIFDHRNNLVTQNENLTNTRDLLLPRLISGKLSVEDLDIQFPPSMQEAPADPESQPEARHA